MFECFNDRRYESAQVIMWVYVCALTTDVMMAAKAVMWVYVYAPTTGNKALVLCVFALADGIASVA